MTFPMTQLTAPGTLPVTLLKRAAALTAAAGLAAGLAACGSDDDGGDGSSDGTDFSAFTATAESAGYTCAELGDTEEPTTGLKNGLSCMPAADKIGTDPMFTLFGTDDVASGKDAAQKAVEKAGGAGALRQASMRRCSATCSPPSTVTASPVSALTRTTTAPGCCRA